MFRPSSRAGNSSTGQYVAPQRGVLLVGHLDELDAPCAQELHGLDGEDRQIGHGQIHVDKTERRQKVHHRPRPLPVDHRCGDDRHPERPEQGTEFVKTRAVGPVRPTHQEEVWRQPEEAVLVGRLVECEFVIGPFYDSRVVDPARLLAGRRPAARVEIVPISVGDSWLRASEPFGRRVDCG
jgi:hypothetical protein